MLIGHEETAQYGVARSEPVAGQYRDRGHRYDILTDIQGIMMMPQNAPLSVMRLLHTLMKATGPHDDANRVPAK